MPGSQSKRVAREGRGVVSLIQGLFNQASTSGPGGSKDHNMHNDSLPVWCCSSSRDVGSPGTKRPLLLAPRLKGRGWRSEDPIGFGWVAELSIALEDLHD